MFHPGAASVDCRDCCRRLYDLETGKPKTYRSGPKREIKYYDGPDHKPPCKQGSGDGCPKESPEKAGRHELTADNFKTLGIYRQVRATHGHCLTEAMKCDRLLMENLAIVDQVYRQWESTHLGRSISNELLPLLVKQHA